MVGTTIASMIATESIRMVLSSAPIGPCGSRMFIGKPEYATGEPEWNCYQRRRRREVPRHHDTRMAFANRPRRVIPLPPDVTLKEAGGFLSSIAKGDAGSGSVIAE